MKPKLYKLSETNQKALDSYLQEMKFNGSGDNDRTFDSHEKSIRKVLSVIGKNYDQITVKNIKNHFSNDYIAPSTRELYKTKFRCFIRYHFGEESELYKCIKIKSKVFKKTYKSFDDVLTDAEIKKVIDSNLELREKALFEIITISGIRRRELLKLKLSNIHIENDEIILNIIDSKTRKRNIRLIAYKDNPCAFYPNNLVEYVRTHPFKNNKNSPLFYSRSFKGYGAEIKPTSINKIFTNIQKKVGLQKKLTPHILRHTCATYDGYHLTKGELDLKFGWSPKSNTASQYCHYEEELHAEHLKRKAGLTKDVVKNESECPYCGHMNNINDKKCGNCQRIIDKKMMAKETEEKEALKNKVADLENKLNKFLDHYESLENSQLNQINHKEELIRFISEIIGHPQVIKTINQNKITEGKRFSFNPNELITNYRKNKNNKGLSENITLEITNNEEEYRREKINDLTK